MYLISIILIFIIKFSRYSMLNVDNDFIQNDIRDIFYFKNRTLDENNIKENLNCWKNNSSCVIKIKLFTENEKNNSAININCTNNKENNELLIRNNNENEKILLNGCQINSKFLKTFNLQLIPNYENLHYVILENFQIIDENLIIPKNNQIYELYFQKNEFKGENETGKIHKNHLLNLDCCLKTLHFIENNIKLIENKVFENLMKLTKLVIIEKNLAVNSNTIQNVNLKFLTLSSIKIIDAEFFENLPNNLIELNINLSNFNKNHLQILITEFLEIINLIDNKNISSITIIDNKNQLKILNLTGNYLNEINIQNCINLQILDLSKNLLQILSNDSFFHLKNLSKLYLQENHLKSFTIDFFYSSIQSLSILDLRNNFLRKINIIDKNLIFLYYKNFLSIFVNDNPWDCLWLLNITIEIPEIYQILKYEKFTNRINVNGLNCITYFDSNTVISLSTTIQTPTLLPTSVKLPFKPLPPLPPNIPKETRKNQKFEAMMVVLSLFLGVAFLTFLLYLWIKCQKMFHLSFYRSTSTTLITSADRCDIIRKLDNNNHQIIGTTLSPISSSSSSSKTGIQHLNTTTKTISCCELPSECSKHRKQSDNMKNFKMKNETDQRRPSTINGRRPSQNW